ncbi:hypothetical protein [Streptomyces sp. NPDC001759]
MSSIKPSWSERELPAFFTQWREEWKDPDLIPENYLDFEGGLHFVLAAAWLFCPETIEYRDCVFLKEYFDRETVDNWFVRLGDDRERIEAVTNQVNLWSVFTNTLAKGESQLREEIPQLAVALGECWQGILATRYPDLEIRVRVSDEEDGSYGPTVTFYAARVSADFG